jgi:hypothetical protein
LLSIYIIYTYRCTYAFRNNKLTVDATILTIVSIIVDVLV